MSLEPSKFRLTTRPIGSVDAGPWSWKALVAVLLVSLAVRLLWLWNVNTMPVTDYWWYFERAVSLSTGNGYAVNGEPTAYWPPGYSLFLSPFFMAIKPAITLAKALNLLLVMLSLAVTFRLAHRLFRSNAIAVVATLMLSLHLNWIAYSGILAAEPLYTLLSLVGVYWSLDAPGNRKRSFLVGVVLGMATLVRPQAVLLPLLALLWARRDSGNPESHNIWSSIRVAYVGLLLVVVPWAARNVIILHEPIVVSTNMGDNLLIGNNAAATGRYMPPDEALPNKLGESEFERDARARGEALTYARENPGVTARLWPNKLWHTFGYSSDGPYWAFQKVKEVVNVPGTGVDRPLYKFSQRYTKWYHGAVMLLFLGSLLGALVLRFRAADRHRLPAVGLVLISYTALLSMAFFGNPRFAFPVLPFICMYAAWILVLASRSLVAAQTQN